MMLKKKKRMSLGDHQKQIMHSTNILEHTLIFSKCMITTHVFMNLVSLSKKIQPSLILRFGKIVCVLGIRTTRTEGDDQCSSTSH